MTGTIILFVTWMRCASPRRTTSASAPLKSPWSDQVSPHLRPRHAVTPSLQHRPHGRHFCATTWSSAPLQRCC